MTSHSDEEELRRTLREASDGIEPSDGAQQRILDAALARHVDADDIDDADEDDDGGVEKIEAAPLRRSRRRFVPLTAAAAVLVITAVVLSVATLGSTWHGGPSGGSASPIVTPTTDLSVNGATWSSSSPPTAPLQSSPAQGLSFYAAATARHANAGVSDASARQSTSPAGATGVLSPKVVAVGTVAMRVASSHLQTVLSQLTVLVIHDGGYVASSKVVAGSPGESSTATVVLRVPEHHFDSLVSVVQHYGTPTSVVTNSTDVTGQYVDYQAHIAALEASRTQYLAILAKAGSISSILEVQQQINVLQTQIDELEGQRNVLVNEAAYSMLTVNLNPGQGPAGASPSGLSTAWHDSIGGFVTGFESVVRAAGPALFGVLCLLVLFVLGRLSWRAARRRMI
jgi:Domain of unknown function (DUF4349)